MNIEQQTVEHMQLRNTLVTPIEAWHLLFVAGQESLRMSHFYYGRQEAADYIGQLFEAVERRAANGNVEFLMSFVLDEAANRMRVHGEELDDVTMSGINSTQAQLAYVFSEYKNI